MRRINPTNPDLEHYQLYAAVETRYECHLEKWVFVISCGLKHGSECAADLIFEEFSAILADRKVGTLRH